MSRWLCAATVAFSGRESGQSAPKINGTDVWKSTGFHDLERARRAARDIEARIRSGDLGWGSLTPTVNEWWDTYRTSYTPRKRAPHRDPQLIAPFLRVYGTTRLDAIEASDCERWVAERSKFISPVTRRRFADDTIRREHGFLKGFFQRAVKNGKLAENPWAHVKAPHHRARTRVLSHAEEARLRAALRDDYDRLLTVILGTGMREAELLGLHPRNITGSHVWVTGKFGKSRKIPLRTDVRKALEQQRSGQDYWTQAPSSLRQCLKEACVRARIPHTTIHDLRRTFASRCAAANMPPKMLQEILGHASIEITMKHYVHVDEEHARRTIEQVEPALHAQRQLPHGRLGPLVAHHVTCAVAVASPRR